MTFTYLNKQPFRGISQLLIDFNMLYLQEIENALADLQLH